MNKQFLTFLTKLFNTGEDTFKDQFNADGTPKDTLGQFLIDKYATDIVSKNKTTVTERFEEGFKKATKEISEKYNKLIKEKFGIDTDEVETATILDLAVTETNKKVNSKLTTDQVKAHPDYIALEKAKKDEIKTLTDTHNAKILELETKSKKAETLKTIKAKARELFLKQNPVLSEDAAKKEKQIDLFLSTALNSFDYEMDDKGNIIIMKDGKRAEDNLQNALDFEKYISEQTVGTFDVKQQKKKDSPGSEDTKKKGDETETVVYNFVDKADFDKQFWEEQNPENRVKMQDSWAEANKK